MAVKSQFKNTTVLNISFLRGRDQLSYPPKLVLFDFNAVSFCGKVKCKEIENKIIIFIFKWPIVVWARNGSCLLVILGGAIVQELVYKVVSNQLQKEFQFSSDIGYQSNKKQNDK